MDKNEKDVMDAREIADELEKLIESEKSEGETDDQDVQDLEDALTLIHKFMGEEASEPAAKEDMGDQSAVPQKTDVVDTGVLTGPMSGLKNFLIRKASDNEQPQVGSVRG